VIPVEKPEKYFYVYAPSLSTIPSKTRLIPIP
jgi:hypothetical protein